MNQVSSSLNICANCLVYRGHEFKGCKNQVSWKHQKMSILILYDIWDGQKNCKIDLVEHAEKTDFKLKTVYLLSYSPLFWKAPSK